jgi:hypothetical protein
MNRPDFFFSYWIFAWYLLYISKIVKGYNPKFAIIIGILENIWIILLMIYYKTKTPFLVLFVVMFVLLKVLPLYTLWNNPIHFKDVVATISLFLIYVIWIYLNGRSLGELMNQTMDLVVRNKNTFPGIAILYSIINKF